MDSFKGPATCRTPYTPPFPARSRTRQPRKTLARGRHSSVKRIQYAEVAAWHDAPFPSTVPSPGRTANCRTRMDTSGIKNRTVGSCKHASGAEPGPDSPRPVLGGLDCDWESFGGTRRTCVGPSQAWHDGTDATAQTININ